MTGRRPQITGYVYKDGKLIKSYSKISVSARLRRQNFKKVTVKRKGKP